MFAELIYSFHQYMADCDYSFYIIISNEHSIVADYKMIWMPESSAVLGMQVAG